jgi:hypothetical protein
MSRKPLRGGVGPRRFLLLAFLTLFLQARAAHASLGTVMAVAQIGGAITGIVGASTGDPDVMAAADVVSGIGTGGPFSLLQTLPQAIAFWNRSTPGQGGLPQPPGALGPPGSPGALGPAGQPTNPLTPLRPGTGTGPGLGTGPGPGTITPIPGGTNFNNPIGPGTQANPNAGGINVSGGPGR